MYKKFLIIICVAINMHANPSDRAIESKISLIQYACIGSDLRAECVSIHYKHNICTCYYYRYDKDKGQYIAGIDDTDDHGYSFHRSLGLDNNWSISAEEFNEQKEIAQAFIAAQKEK